MNIAVLKQLIFDNGYIAKIHAIHEMDADNLTISDILESIQNCELLEDYPESKPLPSCLILGFNINDEPIHTVWGYDNESKEAVLITVYRPDPQLWVQYRVRRKDNGY